MYKFRKVVVILLLVTSFVSKANSQEVVNLDKDKLKLESSVTEQVVEAKEDKGSLVLHGTIDLFSPKGIVFDEGLVKSTKMGFAYEGPLLIQKTEGKELFSNFTSTAFELYNVTKFRDDKTEIKTMFNFLRNLPDTQNGFTEKISEIVVTRKINANQQLLIGQGKRLPIGIDGQILPQAQDTAARAQFARTFSNVRSIGVRNIGTYKYMDYDIGAYDSTRYLQDMFNGQEFVGWVNAKPLANLDEKKYGKLTVGTGYQVGSATHDYNVLGAYAGYKYKKLTANCEYASANGYNGIVNSPNKAGGFYTTLMYDIHPKVQLVGRYDVFDPNKNVSKNSVAEYTAGVNYIVSKNLKFLINYVRQNKETGPDSNMILFVTRIQV